MVATAIHEWVDIAADTGGIFLWVALAVVPVWLWIVWTWPQRKSIFDLNLTNSVSARVETA